MEAQLSGGGAEKRLSLSLSLFFAKRTFPPSSRRRREKIGAVQASNFAAGGKETSWRAVALTVL